LDKEHEIDDFMLPVLKDADTEKKVRELYEKAYGLEPVKADRQSLREKLQERETQFQSLESEVTQAMGFAREKDFDSFFDAVGIPKSDVLRYALELVQREQMPPEQKAAWQQQRETAQRVREYEQQNQQLMQSQQQLMVRQREFELSSALARPDVSAVAQAYETGMGNPGAFREYVIRIGQAYAAQGQDIPAEKAVEEAVRHLRAVNPALGQQTQQQAGPQTSQVVSPNQKPVIPNIQGRGATPIKSTIKSLDDIKRRAAELSAQG
jgi:antitoxin component of RelBE/YafQ-DinJ toxin-antitoxin module